MRRAFRAAAAGAAAAGVWAAVEPGLGRFTHAPHSELRLLGRMLAPERYWLPVGLGVHLLNGAAFGVVFDRLGGRGVVQALAAAQIENACLWPALLVVDALHPDVCDGTWPELATDRRVLVHEVAGHAVFGLALGILLSD
jgi:hypothetical protein